MAFFGKYLSETLSSSERARSIVVPQMLTINDFFFKLSDKVQIDRVAQLLELYECYRGLNPNAEPLDEFIFWGDVILGDFNKTSSTAAS